MSLKSRDIIWVLGVAALIEPLIILNRVHRILSFDNYLDQLEYFLVIAIPFGSLLIYWHWKESVKRKLGYGWLGEFQVIGKKTFFWIRKLELAPGQKNEVSVSRSFYTMIKIGDQVAIRLDCWGALEEINKVKNFKRRMAIENAHHSQAAENNKKAGLKSGFLWLRLIRQSRQTSSSLSECPCHQSS